MNFMTAIIMLPALVIGLTVHEFAHAWSASLLGDNFSRRQGRVSLNPFRHLSPLGTLAIFLLPIGWGRPVMVNLYNFKRPKRDFLITSLAGPFANLVTAVVCIMLMLLVRHPYRLGELGGTLVQLAYSFLYLLVMMNGMLAVFNLLPIPPLDGSKIWPCLLPGQRASGNKKLGMLSLVVLAVLMWTHALNPILDGTFSLIQQVIPVSDEALFRERFAQGVAAQGQKDWAGSWQLLDEALAINPRSPDSYHWRANARLWQDDLAGALEDIDRALEFRPDWPLYQEFRANTLRRLAGSSGTQPATATAIAPAPAAGD